ncbi:MAG: hypothetical protein WCK64_13490, partial [Synechococcaceae cyanobacterium ELA445]
LVGGVAGARPGSRPGGRSTVGRTGGRPGLEGLGRWVENRLDWLLEEEDDWREPWQQPARPPAPERQPSPPADSYRAISREAGGPGSWQESQNGPRQPAAEPRGSRRQPLEAISLRVPPLLPPRASTPAPERTDGDQTSPDDWPDPEDFSVPRWQRPAQRREPELGRSPQSTAPTTGSRPLPRSTRRRG